MLTEICAELRNYFPVHSHGFETGEDVYEGTFEISGGEVSPLDFIQENQYYRIIGSVFNDGVHKKLPANSQVNSPLIDETFTGAIWAMAVPPQVIALASEIEQYNTDNAESPFTSESFGGYSYTRAKDENGANVSWKTAFKSRLNNYRRMRVK